MSNRRLLSVVIPVFNEGKTIREVLENIFRINTKDWEREVIVVDDGSTDDTRERIEETKLLFKEKYPSNARKLKVIAHKRNLGKGAAVQTGLKMTKGEAIVIQDADLEYNPREIPKLLAEYSPERVVFGSRNIHAKRQGYRIYVWGDKFLTTLVNLFLGTNLTDVFTGYKLIPADIFKSIRIKSQGFEFEMELTIKLLRKKIIIREVPINYSPRSYQEGKKFTLPKAFIEGFRSLAWLFRK